jgi:hypothetical protein
MSDDGYDALRRAGLALEVGMEYMDIMDEWTGGWGVDVQHIGHVHLLTWRFEQMHVLSLVSDEL